MEKKYNLSVDELIAFLCGSEPAGFSEDELRETEARIGAALPLSMRNYLLKCGRDRVSDIFNHLYLPEEISTTYQFLREELEDRAEEYEAVKRENRQKEYDEDGYFQLYCLEEPQWPSITENYVLLWYENQGVWNGGYLLSDLQKGIKEPPVYVSTNDDFLSFAALYRGGEEFLEEMLREAAWELNDEHIQKAEEVKYRASEAGIDLAVMRQPRGLTEGNLLYGGTCLDVEKNVLYFYFASGEYEELQVVSGR